MFSRGRSPLFAGDFEATAVHFPAMSKVIRYLSFFLAGQVSFLPPFLRSLFHALRPRISISNKEVFPAVSFLFELWPRALSRRSTHFFYVLPFMGRGPVVCEGGQFFPVNSNLDPNLAVLARWGFSQVNTFCYCSGSFQSCQVFMAPPGCPFFARFACESSTWLSQVAFFGFPNEQAFYCP